MKPIQPPLLLASLLLALPGQADPASTPTSTPTPPSSAKPSSSAKPLPTADPGGFCLTPAFGQTHLLQGALRWRGRRFNLQGPNYALTCAGAAWRSGNTQAILEGDIVLKVGMARYVVAANDAVYDAASGAVALRGAVRVTTTGTGTVAPIVSTGDSGTISLGPGVPQIVLHTDPPEPTHSVRRLPR